MNTVTKSTIAGILGMLVMLGGVSLTDDNAYYCESRQMVMNCNHLSESGNRCYPDMGTTKGYRDCSEGWVMIVDEKSLNSWSKSYQLCTVDGCIDTDAEGRPL